MIKNSIFVSINLLCLLSLLLLPGCWPLSELRLRTSDGHTIAVEDGSPVLMKLNGQPVITLKMLDDEINRDMSKSYLADDENWKWWFKTQLFMALVEAKVLEEYIHRNHIDQSPEYKKDLEEFKKEVAKIEAALAEDKELAATTIRWPLLDSDDLNWKYFIKYIPVEVSEAEMRRYYDTHKKNYKDEPINTLPFEQEKATIFDKLKEEKQFNVREEELNKYKAEYHVEIDAAPLIAQMPKDFGEKMKGQLLP